MSTIFRKFWKKKPKIGNPVVQPAAPGLDEWKALAGDYVAVVNKVQELKAWKDDNTDRLTNALHEVDTAVATPDYTKAADKFDTLRTEVNRVHGEAVTRRKEEQDYHSAHDPVKDKIAEILSPGDDKLPDDLKGERTTFAGTYRSATGLAGTGNFKDALPELNKILGQVDGLLGKVKGQLKAESDYTKLHKVAEPKVAEVRKPKDDGWPSELKTERNDLLKEYTDLDQLTSANKFGEALPELKRIAAQIPPLLVKMKQWEDAKNQYLDAKTKLENGDLKKVPGKAPKGLETEFGAVATAKSKLPADPKTVAEYNAGHAAVGELATKVQEYLAAVARQKSDCDKEYGKIARIYKEAKAVPELSEDLEKLIKAMDLAFQAVCNQYKTGKNYAEATELLPALQEKSQAVITAAIKAGLQSKPEISGEQDARATTKLEAMGKAEKEKVQKLLDEAPTEKHRQNLRKAIASGHAADEIETFAARIKDKDEKWLQDNLHLTSNSTGRGIQQQFHMSCQATVVQALKAELDPIYALKLHDENPDVSELAGSDSISMAREQKEMLESTPTEEVDQSEQAKVKNRLDTAPEGDVNEFNRILALATTNWEKNKLLRVIANPNNYTPVAVEQYFNTQVKGKGPMAGVAVHKTDKTSIGMGRVSLDLYKKTKDVTGLDFERTELNDTNRAAAVDETAQALKLGRPVPLSVGGPDGVPKHFVLAVAIHDGPPKTFFIHDPADGTTVTRTEAQLKGSDMKLPSGWSKLTAYVKPTPA